MRDDLQKSAAGLQKSFDSLQKGAGDLQRSSVGLQKDTADLQDGFIRYTSLNNYLKATFHEKVYKLSLSCAVTCPNRDGTVGFGGCIFCAGGSSAFSGDPRRSIKEQLKAQKRLVSKKSGQKFIAYFGSYTATYGDCEKLRAAFLTAAEDEQVVALSVATRPDCLPPKIIEILKEVQARVPVFVELGLQTANDRTAKFLNRGTVLSDFDRAVKLLKSAGFFVVFHVIIGLPHETADDLLNTVDYCVKMKADGIKLQLLHVLRGTELATLYQNGEFDVLSMDEYIALLCAALKRLPPEVVVHRLTGDGAKKDLIAPLWSADKHRVLNAIAAVARPYEL